MARLVIDHHLDALLEFTDVAISMPRRRRRGGTKRHQRLRRLAGDTRREEAMVLDAVSVSIDRGESVAVLGTRTGGRDEFMRLAVGTLIPDRGSVRRSEVIVPMLERSRSLVGTSTVRQNVYLLGGLLGMAHADVEAKLPWIIETLGIGKAFDGYLRSAPRLTRQKLVWCVTMATGARAFAIEDSIVVGEPAYERRCWEYVEGLKASGASFLLASDQPTLVERFCDRALVIDGGTLKADTSVNEGLALMPKGGTGLRRRREEDLDEEDDD
jgi:ABC-type polysaccharide/polyol phosphate transport system ATPase subunit